MEIRYTERNDISDLKNVLDQTGLFSSALLEDVLNNFLEGDTEDLWLTCEQGGTAIGFCYASPDQADEGTWHMLGLAVLPEYQRKTLGTELAHQMEAELEEQSAKVMFVDLADAPAEAEAFFLKAGYSEETPDTLTFKKAIG